jgi:hypothetical protein
MAGDENRPLTHGRDLHAYLDAIGAKQPNRAEALELLRGIQMGVQVDDASHLVRPISVPAAHYDIYWAVAAGQRGHAQALINSRGGAYITFVLAEAVNHRMFTTPPQAGVVIAAPNVSLPGIQPSEDLPVTQVIYGDNAGSPVNYVDLISNQPYVGCPFWLPPGAQLNIYQLTVATVMRVQIGIQEIP